jgi:hypothetical protein
MYFHSYSYTFASIQHVIRNTHKSTAFTCTIKKNLRGYWNFFFCANAFKVLQQLEYMFKKFSYFFFICFLAGLPNRVLAGTK